MTEANGQIPAADLVAPEVACPRCGERRQDNLVWQNDTEVRCSTCQCVYEP